MGWGCERVGWGRVRWGGGGGGGQDEWVGSSGRSVSVHLLSCLFASKLLTSDRQMTTPADLVGLPNG